MSVQIVYNNTIMESDKNRVSQQVIQLAGDGGTGTANNSVISTECANKNLPSGTTATHNRPKKTRADYQREYRQRLKAKQKALDADEKNKLKKNKAEYAKILRARQKEMRQQGISMGTEAIQDEKREKERKRKAANSQAYRARKKLRKEQNATRKTEESATTELIAEPKQTLGMDAVEEDEILQNERFRKNLSYAKTAPLEISVRNWFVKMKRYLDEHNLYEIKPSRIFTCEEAAFIFNPDGKKVLVRKGDRNDFSFAHNHVNECATSFFTANATGTLAPPMIVFKQERIKPGIVAALPESWTIGTTSDGWMTKESFHEYLKVFDQWLTQCGIQRPVVMFIDANSVFPTQSLSALCSSLEIHLLPIHPNMGHILQPLDNLFLDALKETWLIVTDQWRTNNDRKRVRKEHFAELLWESLKMVESVGTITEGFKACGIHPFSADAVDYGRKGRFKMQTIIRPKEEEKFEETKMIVDPQFAPEEVRSHLEFLEDFIDDETLKSFREAESFEIWTGEMRDASLFCLWRKLRKMSHTGDNYNDFEGNSEAGASGGHFMRMDDSFQSTGIIKSEIEDQFDGNFTTWMDNSLEQS